MDIPSYIVVSGFGSPNINGTYNFNYFDGSQYWFFRGDAEPYSWLRGNASFGWWIQIGGDSYYRNDSSDPCTGTWYIWGLGAAPVGTTTCYYPVTTTTTSTSTPVTTTTTSTPAPVTTTTTSTPSPFTTTTTSTPTVTATTTTVRPPLLIVKTSLYKKVKGKFIEAEFTDASDNPLTRNRPFAQSLNFGTLAPGETSETMIIALNVPYVKGIRNIKLGLTNTGGLTFTNQTFGINSSIELRSDITPDNHFEGLNTKEPSPTNSEYTISIDNRDKFNSAHVYLNVKLPLNQNLGFGIIGFKWYFEYAD